MAANPGPNGVPHPAFSQVMLTISPVLVTVFPAKSLEKDEKLTLFWMKSSKQVVKSSDKVEILALVQVKSSEQVLKSPKEVLKSHEKVSKSPKQVVKSSEKVSRPPENVVRLGERGQEQVNRYR